MTGDDLNEVSLVLFDENFEEIQSSDSSQVISMRIEEPGTYFIIPAAVDSGEYTLTVTETVP